MKPDRRFLSQPGMFWANVRTISQQVGYTRRGSGLVKAPTFDEMQEALSRLGLVSSHILDRRRKPTKLGKRLRDYFKYRARALNTYVEPRLMEVRDAKALFKRLRAKLRPRVPIPMNKQKGTKRAPAYFTAIVNMLIEANSKGLPCDYAPRQLTTITRNGKPLRTLARRIDGAFPSTVDPAAVWEIKEYYYTTTFGSRVADGVYESLLDGMELDEVNDAEGIKVLHYLMIDAHYTWWECGRSYLCRILDMLHMGYVDEVLFGKEVTERLPKLVGAWVRLVRRRRRKERSSPRVRHSR